MRARLSCFGRMVSPWGQRVASIKKAEPKTKAAGKKTAKKKSAKKSVEKTEEVMDLVEVRKEVAVIVGKAATKMAQAVVDEAVKGQLAPVKYLFEVLGLYPATSEGSAATAQEDTLTRTLLRRLGLPEVMVLPGEEEPARKVKRPAEDSADGQSAEGSQAAGGETATDTALGNSEGQEGAVQEQRQRL